MANPPITIGPFTNVPAPGSPIRSDWPQSISTYVTTWSPVGALLARSIRTTDFAGIGSGGGGISTNVSITIATKRYIRIVGHCNLSAAANVGAYLVGVVAAVPYTPRMAQLNNINTGAILEGSIIATLNPGTYSIGVNVHGNLGTVTIVGAADPAYIEVYDAGVAP